MDMHINQHLNAPLLLSNGPITTSEPPLYGLGMIKA